MTVYDNKRTFTCSANAEVIGPTEGLPYLFTVFCDYTSTDGTTAHGLLTVNVQSKYPPFVSQSERGKPAISLYANGYDNFRMHTSWNLTDNSAEATTVPYCYLDPVTMFVRNLAQSSFSKLGTGLIQAGQSGTGLKYASTPIEDYPHVVDDTTIGQLVIEKYGAYNYAHVMAGTFARVLINSSQWSTPTSDVDLGEKRLVIHIRSRTDPTTYFFSTRIVDLDYRIIYGESFASGEDWLAWCKAR